MSVQTVSYGCDRQTGCTVRYGTGTDRSGYGTGQVQKSVQDSSRSVSGSGVGFGQYGQFDGTDRFVRSGHGTDDRQTDSLTDRQYGTDRQTDSFRQFRQFRFTDSSVTDSFDGTVQFSRYGTDSSVTVSSVGRTGRSVVRLQFQTVS